MSTYKPNLLPSSSKLVEAIEQGEGEEMRFVDSGETEVVVVSGKRSRGARTKNPLFLTINLFHLLFCYFIFYLNKEMENLKYWASMSPWALHVLSDPHYAYLFLTKSRFAATQWAEFEQMFLNLDLYLKFVKLKSI